MKNKLTIIFLILVYSFSVLKNNIYPFYPRYWKKYVKKGYSKKDFEVSYKLNKIRGKMWNLIKRVKSSTFRFSNFYTYLLWLEYNWYNKQIIELNTERIGAETQWSLASHGPDITYNNDSVFFKDMAKKWQNASLQMNVICKANNIEFHHFIQPNQYIEGSKILSEVELEKYISSVDSGTVGYAAKIGFPYIMKHGKEIEDSINIHSLVYLFKNTKETVYRDPWCHLNELGNKLMAIEIAKKVSK